MKRLLAQLRALFRKEKLDRDMAEEMRFHLAQRAADHVDDGMTPDEAGFAAQRKFGNLGLLQEKARDQRAFPSIEHFWRDLQLAPRSLRRSPGFALTALTTLTLGLTLVASTIAVVNAYLVRSMPYPAADRLHHVIYAPVGQPEPRGITALDWTTLNDVVEVADSSVPARFFLREGSEMRTLGGLKVSRGSLEALGVRAVVGRSFSEEDFATGSEPVAMIGHELWPCRDQTQQQRDTDGCGCKT
jgi:hypothetical protein